MELNSFLFPAPDSSFKFSKPDQIVYIPRHQKSKSLNIMDLSKWKSQVQFQTQNLKNKSSPEGYIPCLYLPYKEGSDKILVFFHGNAEDIGWAYAFVEQLQNYLGVHILSVEYPGYSLYIGEPSAERIIEDAEIVYDYINLEVGIPQENIYLFGRSIGSGPSVHLAAKKDPGALILMSAYTSIKEAAKSIFGLLSFMVADRFNNIEEIKKAKCPILLIHGRKDELIPVDHAIMLMKACKHCPVSIKLSETMTHNDYDMDEDVLAPIFEFFIKYHLDPGLTGKVYDFHPSLYKVPKLYEGKENDRTFISKIYEKFL